MQSRFRMFDGLSGGAARSFLVPLLVLALVAACAGDAPTAPNQEPSRAQPPEEPRVPSIPAISGAVAVYERISPSFFGGSSRYVIYDDSTFGLQYGVSGGPEYRGKFVRNGNAFTFNFDAFSVAGPWIAEGVLEKNDLTVKYNVIMWLTDFEDGVYRLVQPQPTTAGIYVADADGSNALFLAGGERPNWSPDGKRLAFSAPDGIHLIDVTGENETRVADGTTPSWSPDGKRIVLTNADGIAVVDVDGSNPTLLIGHKFRTDTYAPWDMGVGKPVWSPDGARIAFEHLGDGDMQPAQIFVMNADGSAVRRGTDPGNGYRYAESDPAWTPDGSKLLFWSYGSGISTVDANGGVPTSIFLRFPTIAYGARPTQSSDGTIAFAAHNATNQTTEIWAIAAEGSLKVLIPNAYDAAFSPDGSKIAFARR